MKRSIAVLCLGIVAACAKEEGTVLQLTAVPVPDGECAITPDADLFDSTGFYDPYGDPIRGIGGGDYALPIILRNNLAAADDDPQSYYGDANIRVEGNSVSLLGFDVCVFRADTEALTKFGAADKGPPQACDDVPAGQKRFIASSGTVEPSGGLIAVYVTQALDEASLRSIYGAAFDIDAIPLAGVTSESPDDTATRSAAWGTYPTERTARVMVGLKATAKTTNGKPVSSNWFYYPVDLCMGCVAAACGPLTPVTCGDGSAGLEGEGPDYAATCNPFGGQAFDCATFTTCPD